MNAFAFLGLLSLLLVLSASYSGSETGVYSLSRMRLEAEAGSGSRTARLLRALVRRDTALLVTLLVGNNLMLELATQLVQGRLDELSVFPAGARELVITLVLTPVVFVFGELLPKDLFRRRPHQLLSLLLPVLLLSRVLLLPLAWPLVLLSSALQRLFGLGETELVSALRREEVLDVLTIGTREGALPAHAAEIARNVLVLRETSVGSIMVPWERVESVALDDPPEALFESVQQARFTRLPVVARLAGNGRLEIRGYVHQLDVLAAYPEGVGPIEVDRQDVGGVANAGLGSAGAEKQVAEGLTAVPGPNPGVESAASGAAAFLMPLPVLKPDEPVDEALRRMRTSGQRIALVGSPSEPLGLVSLMDLLATISGDPAR